MRLRLLALLVPLLVVAALGLSGCGSASGSDIPNPVTGLITKVGTDYIVVRTTDGQTIRFDNADTEAPADHLRIHKNQKLPVKVTHEPNGDRLIARRIEDAPEP